MTPVRTTVNGSAVAVQAVDANASLLDLLREQLNLKGTKQGCGSGDCGACTVILQDLGNNPRPRAINACITPAAAAQDKHVITVEGLADGDVLHPVQQALIDQHGSQCGFCTPGFVMALTAHSLADDAPKRCSREDIVAAISGNLCRCTGYWPIVSAGMMACGVGAAAQLSHLNGSAQNTEVHSALVTHAADAAHDYQIVHSESQLGQRLQAHAPGPASDAAPQLPVPTIIAGATDAWVAVNQALLQHESIIDISRIHSLKTITAKDGVLHIGACVTHTELLGYFSTAPQQSAAIQELLRRFGSPQVRNRGTIGGNICGGSPIADWPPVLLALDAVATLNSAGATRDIALGDFFQGYRQTSLMPGEYLASVAFDMPASWSQLSFDKISKRYEDDISSVCAAIYIDQQDARVRQVRIAYGGVAATPMRLPEIEALLDDQPLADIDSVSLSAALAEILKPISDVRASADYRLQMATTLLLNRLAFERERG